METFSRHQHTRLLYIVLILPMRNGNPPLIFFISYNWKSSYPTYEEWKPLFTKNISIFDNIVLILPMRNGNNICIEIPVNLSGVLILPMRNGNRFFLNFNFLFQSCSYPTYEEWKRFLLFRSFYVFRRFLSYL